MKILIQLALVALGSYWISSAFGWGFWPVAIALGVLWGGYHLARHFGWFGMAPAPAATRTAGGGSISAGMMKFVVGFSTLTFVMMVGTKVIGVSNNFAFTYLFGWGPRPWLYPTATTDILIWVSLFFLSAVIATLTANGRAKPALVIFGLTLVFLFVVREMPRTGEVARPKPENPVIVAGGGTPTKWDETDQAVSERGVIPTTTGTAWRFGFGCRGLFGTGTCPGDSPKREKPKNVVGNTWNGTRVFLFGDPEKPKKDDTDKSSTMSVAYAAPATKIVKVGKVPTMYHFRDRADGCVTENIQAYAWDSYPKGGRVTVFPPTGSSFIDEPGVDIETHRGPGVWRWCPLDTGAAGIEIWQ